MPLIYIVTASYFAGTLAGGFHAVPLWASGILTIAFASAAIFFRKTTAGFAIIISLMTFSVSLFVYETDSLLAERNSLTEYLDSREESRAIEKVWGTVVKVKGRGDGTGSLVLKADHVRLSADKKLKVDGNVYVRFFEGVDISPGYGERWTFEGRIDSVDGLSPGTEKFYRLEGVSARMYVVPEGVSRHEGKGDISFLMGFGDRLRSRFDKVLRERVSAPYNGILGRMLLGKGVEISPGVTEKFRDAGLVHVLVVSGMHVWFMLGTFISLSFLWKKQPLINFVLLACVLTGYYAVTGGGPSVMRATVMGVVFLAALLFGTDYRAKVALFIAALIMMVVNPLCIYQIGTQLTFMASAGVIFIYPVMASFFPQKTLLFKLFRGFLVAVAAQLPIYPILAYHFNQFCVVSPVSNLLVVPLVGIALPLDFLTCMTGLLPGPLVAVPAFFAEWAARLMLIFADFFAAVPGGHFEVASPSMAWILLYEATIVFLVLALKWTHEKSDEMIMAALSCFGVCAIILVLPSVWAPPLAQIRVTFIDVREGDAALVELPLERSGTRVFRMLVDAGGTWGYRADNYDPGEKSVGRYLLKRGLRRLDLVALSHPEADHMNGMQWLFDNIKIDRFMDLGEPRSVLCEYFSESELCDGNTRPGGHELAPSQDAIYRTLLRIVKERGIEYIPMRAGVTIGLDSGAEIKVLSPDEKLMEEKRNANTFNDISSALRISYGDGAVLFTGDVEISGERWLADFQGENMKCNLMKVPHHGSGNSSSAMFISKASPSVGVISTGGPSYYGHPHESALNRYSRQGIKLYRTDESGNVTCTVSARGKVKCRKSFSSLRF